jgi:Bacterial protein of unknown function (DUF839)
MSPKWIGAVAAGVLAAAAAVAAVASSPRSTDFTNVPNANTKTPGIAAPNILSPELQEVVWAQGSYKLENGTAQIPYYGYLGNGPHVPVAGSNVEASKTEPDKNTYLVFKTGLAGADPDYNYGTHFLYQGHEGGAGYITRINLDADGAHRVTLLASQTDAGVPLRTIDGSTWDPWAQQLLFTTESNATSSVYQATADYPSHVQDISNVTGRGGFEGVQNDDRGNLYLVEDIGGKNGTGPNARAKQPNSFVYRLLPKNPADLSQGGRIQALQVSVNGAPLTFTSGNPDADINGPGYLALHQYGTSYPTKWITIATTDSSTALPGPDDNALAKAAGATPFKRPENGQFRPDSKFREFYFDETGDTDNRTDAAASGGFGAVFKLLQSPTSDAGTISVFYNSDQAHSGFDNVAFLSRDEVSFVEDAGDTLHTQRNALDSAYLFDVTQDYSHGLQPVRFIAEGRDASATIDSGLSGSSGFQNDGDNEITGLHVSDGDPGPHGILGAKVPHLFGEGWRVFWTQQHGDNPTYEVIPAAKGGGSDSADD